MKKQLMYDKLQIHGSQPGELQSLYVQKGPNLEFFCPKPPVSDIFQLLQKENRQLIYLFFGWLIGKNHNLLCDSLP